MYSEITLAVLGKYSTTKVSQYSRMFSEIIQWIGLLRLQHVLGIHWSDSLGIRMYAPYMLGAWLKASKVVRLISTT